VTRTNKRKKQTRHIPDDTLVDDIQEEAMTNKGKKPKLDAEIEMFSDVDIKMEEDSDEDYNIKTTVKHKPLETSKKGVADKKKKKKYAPVSQNPRRNSTRVANTYRLRYKAMFDPLIKEEKFIVIEDHSKDSNAGVKEKVERPPLHREPSERGTCNKSHYQIIQR